MAVSTTLPHRKVRQANGLSWVATASKAGHRSQRANRTSMGWVRQDPLVPLVGRARLPAWDLPREEG